MMFNWTDNWMSQNWLFAKVKRGKIYNCFSLLGLSRLIFARSSKSVTVAYQRVANCTIFAQLWLDSDLFAGYLVKSESLLLCKSMESKFRNTFQIIMYWDWRELVMKYLRSETFHFCGLAFLAQNKIVPICRLRISFALKAVSSVLK